ncbi:MAG: energy transducer TonB [Nitrospira sp.]|nr:MAG: TonB C-terminal domain-containing protein [Nitrospira sp.]
MFVIPVIVAAIAVFLNLPNQAMADRPDTEMVDFVFSHAIDHPRWKRLVSACTNEYGGQYMTILKEGWQKEIELAVKKSVAEKLKASFLELDDPNLFKSSCAMDLIDSILAFNPKYNPEVAPDQQLNAYYEDLTDKALDEIEKHYRDSNSNLESILRKDRLHAITIPIGYMQVKRDYLLKLERFKGQDLTAVKWQDGRDVYMKLADPNQYAAIVQLREEQEQAGQQHRAGIDARKEVKTRIITAVDTSLKVPEMGPGSNVYFAQVRRRINSMWSALQVDVTAQINSVVVKSRLHRDGNMSGVAVEQSSGNKDFDSAGMRAVVSSNPLPGFPPDLTEPYVDATITFSNSKP